MSAASRAGAAAFSKIEKCNSELFTLTYGAIVTQLLKDYEEVDATNAQLEKMCAHMGGEIHAPITHHERNPPPCPSLPFSCVSLSADTCA